MKSDNLILKTDSYKMTHWKQYPMGTEGVYSYFEAREGAQFDKTVFFGLQHILTRYLEGVVVTEQDIKEAERFALAHFGTTDLFNREGWEHIVHEHGGRLPIRIKAVPEGLKIPTGNVMMTVENTDPKCYWLTNYVETLLTHVWYGSTVASLSRATKEMFMEYLDETAETQDALPFMLHDFGYRGVSSDEAAGIGGAAHLINFMGTDTINGMSYAMDFYDAPMENLAFSVPATEHSVMTSLGRAGEYQLLDQLIADHPAGILSVVSDSYDIYAMVEEICKRKDKIMAREGVFVTRPDSMTKEHKTPEELTLWIVQRLWDTYGGTENSKGYKTLDSHVRVLWGDGIDKAGINKILFTLKRAGFSAENMVFGMGGGLLQKINRDTQRFAFKCAAQKRDGMWHDISKDPLDGSKVSKAGRMKLVIKDGEYVTVPEHEEGEDIMETVFEDGEILRRYDFDFIREASNIETVACAPEFA